MVFFCSWKNTWDAEVQTKLEYWGGKKAQNSAAKYNKPNDFWNVNFKMCYLQVVDLIVILVFGVQKPETGRKSFKSKQTLLRRRLNGRPSPPVQGHKLKRATRRLTAQHRQCCSCRLPPDARLGNPSQWCLGKCLITKLRINRSLSSPASQLATWLAQVTWNECC